MDLTLVKIIVALFAGGLLAYLAVTVLRDNITNRLNRLAGAMLFFAGLGPLFIAIDALVAYTSTTTPLTPNSTAYNLHYLWEFFFPLLLIFSWAYPVDRLQTFRRSWLRYIVYVPTLVHLALMLFYPKINSALINLEAATTSDSLIGILLTPVAYLVTLIILALEYFRTYQLVLFGVVNLLYMAVAVYFLESGRSHVISPRLQTQTRIALWGVRIALGLFSIGLVSLLIAGPEYLGRMLTILYLLSAIVGAGFFGYAIIRYQLFDVRLVFRQSFVYTFTSALLVGLYILTVFRAEDFLTPLFGAQAELVSYLVIVLLLLLFQPISNALDNLIRSMFMRTRADYRNIVERFSRQIISVFDPVQLRQMIEETLKTSLLVEQVYFVLYDDKVKEYAITASTDYPNSRILNREDLMLRGINLLEGPTAYDSLSQYASESELAVTLKGLEIKMILPMKDAEHLLGFLALTDKVAGYRYTAEDYNLLGVLSNQMVSALTNARLYVESLERIRLQEEVNMARSIQVNLLPAEPPRMERYSICAGSTPSRTVGGDFYDFIDIEQTNRTGVVIADASGKGMPAALMIAQIQAIIRAEVFNGNRISTILQNTNRQVVASSSPETFVTLLYGELDEATGQFHYANAGHNYPILMRTDGSSEVLDVGGPIIGAFPGMEYQSSCVKLDPGDLIFFFTDGLSEAMDQDEQEYGEERICDFLRDQRKQEPRVIMDAILADVLKFSPQSPPADDTTVVTVKMNHDGVR